MQNGIRIVLKSGMHLFIKKEVIEQIQAQRVNIEEYQKQVKKDIQKALDSVKT
jgi:hypothetical protein